MLNRLARTHWSIENRQHYVRDVSQAEDASTTRTGRTPTNLATIRAAIINALRRNGYLHIPEGRRDHPLPIHALALHGLT